MNRLISVVSCFLVSLMLPCVSEAQQLYVSTESGLGIGNSLGTLGSDTDFPTLCDRHLDPANHFSPPGITEPEECSSAASTWINSFGSSTGIISGVALGFKTDIGARIEVEYFRSGMQYNATSVLGGGGADVQDKSDQELVRGEERIGSVNINSLVGNIYYDLPVSGQLRPYVGGGVGLGMAGLDYAGFFSRNLDPDAIKTADEAAYNGRGNEAVDRQALHERIAGTTTTASHTLHDTILGYQAMVGVDYMLTDDASIGVKGRWIKHAKFSDSNEWDQLRSHSSDNGSGTNAVVYTIETEDLISIGVTLVMKYAF